MSNVHKSYKHEYLCTKCFAYWYSKEKIDHNMTDKNLIGFCPNCMNTFKIDKINMIKKYKMRKVRTDKKPIEYKRQITRERVRRYRERKKLNQSK
ncbi:MAG: hypothetical protein MUO82_10150 [Candidatus Thermoplasmatota archaeon]|nr:hypothetical protein [Candidatus Thermoplasmatota archaeon]